MRPLSVFTHGFVTAAGLIFLALCGCDKAPNGATPPPATPANTSGPATGPGPQGADATAGATRAESDPIEAVIDVVPVSDETSIIANFTHLDIQHNIFASSAILQDANVKATKDLSTHTVYVTPTVIVDWKTVLDTKLEPLSESEKGLDLYRLRINAALINDEIREKAAEQLKKMGYKPGPVALYRYKLIELFAQLPTGASRVGSYPSMALGSTSIPIPPANIVTSIPVEIVGSKADLEAFRKKPKVEARFYASGFSVKQNVTSFALRQFIQLGYGQILTGQAKWETESNYHRRAGGMSANLFGGMIGLGGSKESGDDTQRKKSYVSRNQVKELVSKYAKQVNGVTWTTFGVDSDRSQLVWSMTQQLLSYAQQSTLEIQKVGNDFVIDPALKDDIKPDVYAALNGSTNSAAKLGPSSQTTSGTYAGASATVTSTTPGFDSTTGITWTTGGAVVVPKSINVYQFNEAAWQQAADVSVVETKAEKAEGVFFAPGRIVWKKLVETKVESVFQDIRFDQTLTIGAPNTNVKINPNADGNLASRDGKLIQYQLGVTLTRENDGRGVRISGTFVGHEHGMANRDSTKIGVKNQLLTTWRPNLPPGATLNAMIVGTDRNQELVINNSKEHSGEQAGYAPPNGHIIKSVRYQGDTNDDDLREIYAKVRVQFTSRFLVKAGYIDQKQELAFE